MTQITSAVYLVNKNDKWLSGRLKNNIRPSVAGKGQHQRWQRRFSFLSVPFHLQKARSTSPRDYKFGKVWCAVEWLTRDFEGKLISFPDSSGGRIWPFSRFWWTVHVPVPVGGWGESLLLQFSSIVSFYFALNCGQLQICFFSVGLVWGDFLFYDFHVDRFFRVW